MEETNQKDKHVSLALAYQKEHGCSIDEAWVKTASSQDRLDLLHLTRMKEYQKAHGCSLEDAGNATEIEPAPTPSYGAEHLGRAKEYQKNHGGSLTDALRATAPEKPETVSGNFPGN